MASVVSLLFAKALTSLKDIEAKHKIILMILNSNTNYTVKDKLVLLQFSISWIQNENPDYLWLKKYGYEILTLLAKSSPSDIKTFTSTLPKEIEQILLNYSKENTTDLQNKISSLPECDPINGVELILAQNLFLLLQAKPDDKALHALILQLPRFHPNQDDQFVKFIVNKLSKIKMNPKISETKQEVDRIVKINEHWLNSQVEFSDKRLKLLIGELYQIILHTDHPPETDRPSACVSNLLTGVNPSMLFAGLQALPVALVSRSALVLARWMIGWPYAAVTVQPYLMHALKRLAEERCSKELTEIAVQTVAKLLNNLYVPAMDRVSGVFFFLMIASHGSDQPLQTLVPELPKVVHNLVQSSQKSQVVKRSLMKLAGLCLRLADEHPHLAPQITQAFKDVRVPSEEELGLLFTCEEWFTSVATVADLTLDSAAPTPNSGPRGLCNLGNTCYMNATLQALYFTPKFRQAVLVSTPRAEKEPLLWQLQRLFCLMSHSPRSSISPNAELIAVAKPPGFVTGNQEDCSEFLVYVLNTLHEQELILKNPPAPPPTTSTTPSSSKSTSTTPPKRVDNPESSSPGLGLKRWTTEEDLSDSDPAALLNGRRKARSLAAFDETSPVNEEKAGAPTPPQAPPLTDVYSDSKDSGIHSVGSSADMQEDEEEDPSLETLVQGIFGGKQTTIYKCRECDFEYKAVDKFLDLQLAVPDNDEHLTINDLICYYLQTEYLTGDNQYLCRSCNKLQDATKTNLIQKPPAHLILTIKRFQYDPTANQSIKLMNKVECSDRIYLSGQEYELYSVVLHTGSSAHSGHYHSQVKSRNSWLWMNDEIVSEIRDRGVGSADTHYVLFYKLKLLTEDSDPPLNNLMPRLQTLVQDDIRAFRQSNSTRSTGVTVKNWNNQGPPPPPPAGGCGDNLGQTSGRFVC